MMVNVNREKGNYTLLVVQSLFIVAQLSTLVIVPQTKH